MKVFLQLLVLGALTLSLAVSGHAGNYSVIHSFGILTNATGFDPIGPLTQGPDGTLYGVTSMGEGNMGATVFRVNTNGASFQVLKFFTNNVEGTSPNGGLLLVGSMLYGTTSEGGTNSVGNLFRLTTSGAAFTNLYQFDRFGSDAYGPNGPLILSGGLLYGTTQDGGSGGGGVIYKITTNGTGIASIADFGYTNGASPLGMVLSGGAIYGVTSQGPSNNYGTIFKVNTDTTSFTNLHIFLGPEGFQPQCQLLLVGPTLYGTTESGGANGSGVVFAIGTNGFGYTNFFNFSSGAFNPSGNVTNLEGYQPEGGLVLVGTTLYGTTARGGTNGFGTIFEVNTSGGGFSPLATLPDGGSIYSGMIRSNSTLYGAELNGGTKPYGCLFSLDTSDGSVSNFYAFHGSDGNSPKNLLLTNGTLYGVTVAGGNNGNGMIYRLSTNGSAYTNLYNFNSLVSAVLNPLVSATPSAGPVLAGNALYDTAEAFPGNASGSCVFRINTDGSGYTNICDFTNGPTTAAPTYFNGTLFGPNSKSGTIFALGTNGQNFTNFYTLPIFHGTGADPGVPLLISGNVIYGVAEHGGTNGSGMIFSLNTNGSNFKIIYTFSALSFFDTNVDGNLPSAALILSGNTLYGTAQLGGFYGFGTVYRVDTGGTNFQNLHSFTDGSDGQSPLGSLLLSGSTLYGMAYAGGSGQGTVFSVATNGANFTVLHTFLGPEGGYPLGGLVQSSNTLYGTASEGGAFSEGVIFSIVPEVVLTATFSAGKIILSWPDPTYNLQSAPALTNTFSTVGGATSPYTNPVAGTQRYFRLISN